MATSRPLVAVLARWFGQGLLVLVPLGGTIWLVWRSNHALDTALSAPFPGFGVLVAVPVILLTGFLNENVVGAALVRLFEALLARLPLVRIVYASLKDLLGAFVGEKKS